MFAVMDGAMWALLALLHVMMAVSGSQQQPVTAKLACHALQPPCAVV
jgi:hypothetical protein